MRLRPGLIPTRATGSNWSPTGGIREPEWDKLPGNVWVGLRPGLLPTRATGSNWWAELESGSGVGVAAILSISRITSSNRELVITSPRLWLLFVLVVGGWVGLRLDLDLGSGKAVGLRLGPALGHVFYVDASIGCSLTGGGG